MRGERYKKKGKKKSEEKKRKGVKKNQIFFDFLYGEEYNRVRLLFDFCIMSEILSPAEITETSSAVGVEKTHKPWYKIAINGILAGMFIGIGAMFSINSISGLEALPYGAVKAISGLAFSIGLILVMVAGSELFTGDALIITSRLDKKNSLKERFKNLGIIWIANFVGALILIALLVGAKWYDFDHGGIADTILNLGVKKVHYGRWQALFLGILCNILVCLGVWLSWAGKRLSDKILGIIFPVTAFVACGFEHSVANMFYLPFAYVLKIMGFGGEGVSDITLGNIFWGNLLPVSIGNLIGGAVFVGLLYWILYHKEKGTEKKGKRNKIRGKRYGKKGEGK